MRLTILLPMGFRFSAITYSEINVNRITAHIDERINRKRHRECCRYRPGERALSESTYDTAANIRTLLQVKSFSDPDLRDKFDDVYAHLQLFVGCGWTNFCESRNVDRTKAVTLLFSLTLKHYLNELVEYYRDFTSTHWSIWTDEAKEASYPALKALQELVDMAYELEHIACNEARVALGIDPVDENTRRIPMQLEVERHNLCASSCIPDSPYLPYRQDQVVGLLSRENPAATYDCGSRLLRRSVPPCGRQIPARRVRLH